MMARGGMAAGKIDSQRKTKMNKTLRIIAISAAIALGGTLPGAAEEVDHYAPLPSDTLAEALENFVTYNRKIEEVLAQDDLSVQDMEEVHQLTYTIEVALAKINAELGALPTVLEKVHLASEGDDPDRLRALAETYLSQARLLDR